MNKRTQLTDYLFPPLVQPSDPTLRGLFLYLSSKRHLPAAAAVSYSSIFFLFLWSSTYNHSSFSSFDRSLGLFSHYSVNQSSTNLGSGVEIPYVFVPFTCLVIETWNSYWPVLPSLLASRSLSRFITKVKGRVLELSWRFCQKISNSLTKISTISK